MESEITKAQNMIFQSMREKFGEDWYKQVPRWQWSMWRGHISKQLFAIDIIALDAISVIGGIDKRQWPVGTGFFSRVRDLCLLQRNPKPSKPRLLGADHGMEGLAGILQRR